MKAEFFTNTVLEHHLKPFINRVYPNGHRFMLDNDPKHTSNLAKEYYTTSNINWWHTPPESPELNPREPVWHELKHFLRKTHKPQTKEQLENGIRMFWQTRMTREKCNRYIGHIAKVVPVVIAREGCASG